MRAYIAGPLFNEGERWFQEQIEARVARVGIETFLPHRENREAMQTGRSIEEIFGADVAAIGRAALVVANLNGITIDDGTAWELGYAYAQGKHLVGVHTDMRVNFRDWPLNVMILCSLHKLVCSLDELEAYLREYVAEHSHSAQPGAG